MVALIVSMLMIVGASVGLGRWRVRGRRRTRKAEIEGETGPTYSINPVGATLAAIGGLALVLASFLPLDEPASVFARVESNTLIQHGEWWLLIGGAAIVLAALSSYMSGQRKHTSSVLLLGAIAAALVIYFAQDEGLRTLYPVGVGGEPDATAAGAVVPLGIAVYVAGAGVLLALIGGWVMHQTAEVVSASDEEATRRCPDCAETILAAARVCKHCGARMDGEEPSPPYPPAPEPMSPPIAGSTDVL